jgi:cobalamin transport system substrate-binding protein
MSATRCALALALLALGCGAPRGGDGAPARAGRLAVLSPSAAETLVALGATDRIVAVGDYVVWPPEIQPLPRIGAYDAPSPERLLALGVDLLVTTAGIAGREEREELAAHGIATLELDTATYPAALRSIEELGARVGRATEARELVAGIERRVAAVADRTAGLTRRRVLVVVGRDPLFVAGPGSHLDRLIEAAGGENVGADLGSPWAQASLEAMLERSPEVVIDMSDNAPDVERGLVLGEWSRWPFLPAVRAGRVASVDPWRISIPGPRLGELADLLARLIHPEALGAPSAEELGPPPEPVR